MPKEVKNNCTETIPFSKDNLIMLLKYIGFSYPQIAKKTDYHFQSIKVMFARDGRLCEKYKEFTIEMDKLQREKAGSILMNNLRAALNVWVKGLKSRNENIRFGAADRIIERVLGKVPDKLDANVKNTDMVEAFKLLKELKKDGSEDTEKHTEDTG